MRAVEINLFPRTETSGDTGQFEEVLENFVTSLHRDNHLCGDWVALELENKVQVRALAPADDALDRANWNIYVQRWWQKLNEMSHAPIEMGFVPEVKPNMLCCDCVSPSSFILYSTHSSYELPVDCLDCGRPVPLYRLPLLNGEEEHWTLSQWHENYQILDQLYMNSWWGERMAYHQLSNPRSSFMKHSREVAAHLERATSKPTYVFLINIYEPRGEMCTRCGRPWLWPSSPNERYNFKCDHCRLVSEEPRGDLDPDPLRKMHP